MRVIITENYDEISREAANIIATQVMINSKSVLGLATGATPIGTYKELIRMYQEGYADFSEVKTFNLDEYLGLGPDHKNSYTYYMTEIFFKHINIPASHIHIPNGLAGNMQAECQKYESAIMQAGGIDIQLLGVGRNGHIGFNEPDVKFEAATHLVNLNMDTIRANARFFNCIDEVPKKAISMGIKTIMQSRKILLLANGVEKAEIISKMLLGKITPEIPASILQMHPDVVVILDKEAASQIKGYYA